MFKCYFYICAQQQSCNYSPKRENESSFFPDPSLNLYSPVDGMARNTHFSSIGDRDTSQGAIQLDSIVYTTISML